MGVFVPKRWGFAFLLVVLCACADVPPDRYADRAGNNGPANNGATNNGANNGPGNNGWRPPEFEPADPTLHRLTAAEYRAVVADLTGVQVDPTGLEADTSLHGFVSVAASELTISPRAAEQFEEASWDVATAVTVDAQRGVAFLGCDPAANRDACFAAFTARFGRLAWRRALTDAEIGQVAGVGVRVADRLRDPWHGARAIVATLLQSPHFLFRVEVGEADPDNPGWRRYTDYEMASRLSFLLWGTSPDEDLLAAAERGELVTEAGLRAQAQRLLDDPRADAQLTSFFVEFLGLERLEVAQKDRDLFPQYNQRLRDSMRREIEQLFIAIALEERDFREILTSEETWVDADLAAIYGLPHSGDGVIQAHLNPAEARGGLIGRAGMLTLLSHATLNSPTYRGRFVRSRLLCTDIPPPPEGVIAALEEDREETRTLRERLDQHRADPACSGCHDLMDPLGFPLEHFDPIGRWRDNDNGFPIDATGRLDAVDVDGAAELGAAVAANPGFSNCVVRRLYRHATGHLEAYEEEVAIIGLDHDFIAGEYRFKALVLALVLSDGFRKAGDPDAEGCGVGGETRPCASACGDGIETCDGQRWSGCTAPEPQTEVCNGADDDCDGVVDNDLTRACEGACGGGVQVCETGQWSACQAPEPAPETCNGADDDCDGEIDEDIGVDVREVLWTALAAQHFPCDGSSQTYGPDCNAAVNRYCASLDCAATGFGPVEFRTTDATVTCLPAEDVSLVSSTYTELSREHPVCNGVERQGPNCNAAIHRLCANRGMVSGFGPLENSGDGALVACTPGAEVVHTSYTELARHHGECNQATRIGQPCNAAIHRFCVARGANSGFGPVENSGDVAVITCVGGR